jgi:hypothetical protein
VVPEKAGRQAVIYRERKRERERKKERERERERERSETGKERKNNSITEYVLLDLHDADDIVVTHGNGDVATCQYLCHCSLLVSRIRWYPVPALVCE